MNYNFLLLFLTFFCNTLIDAQCISEVSNYQEFKVAVSLCDTVMVSDERTKGVFLKTVFWVFQIWDMLFLIVRQETIILE